MFARRLLCLAAALVLSAAGAATVKWGEPKTIAKDTDVLTEGRRVFARCYGASVKVNGVGFTAGDHPRLAIAGPENVEAATFGGDQAPFTELSEAYRTLIAGGGWNDGAPGTITLKDLVVGHEYVLQIWVNDSRDYGIERNQTVKCGEADPGVTLKYNVARQVGGVGQWVVGTFTADAATLVIALNGNQSTQINALQLRDKSLPAGGAVAKWEAPKAAAKDSDVSTEGKLVFARCYSSACTVNGVAFKAEDDARLVVKGVENLAGDAFVSDQPPFSELSEAYRTLLTGGIWNEGAAGTVTLKDLVVGREYLVQLWISDAREYGIDRNATVGYADDDARVTLLYNAAKKVGGVGQFVTGTFKAEATSLVLALAGNQSTQLNAIQLREK